MSPKHLYETARRQADIIICFYNPDNSGYPNITCHIKDLKFRSLYSHGIGLNELLSSNEDTIINLLIEYIKNKYIICEIEKDRCGDYKKIKESILDIYYKIYNDDELTSASSFDMLRIILKNLLTELFIHQDQDEITKLMKEVTKIYNVVKMESQIGFPF